MLQRICRVREDSTSSTRLTVYTSVFVCFGLVIPYITAHAYGLQGTVFLPMHIPVLLCGFFCGAKRGFICGVITPIISSFLTAMPPVYPMLPIMTVELSTYGLISGILYERGCPISLTQITAMISGRALYAVMFYLLLLNDPAIKLGPKPILASFPVLSMFILSIPGILIQLTLIPPLVHHLSRHIERRRGC